MELEIAEKNDNPLLHRQEVQIVIRHENESTPKRSEVIQNLSEKMKAKKDLIIIDHLKNKYGKMESQGYAKINKKIVRKGNLKKRLKRRILNNGQNRTV